jgi:Spy/CpxP family protein refolding chaperone
MNRTLKVSLLVAGIFACGVVVGGVAGRHHASKSNKDKAQQGPSSDGFGMRVMRKLAEEIELTPEQRAAIDPIISKAGDELRDLRRESVKQTTVVVEAMDAAVAAQLTPAQREKFIKLKEEQKARMKALFEERQRRRGENGEREPGADGKPPSRGEQRERPAGEDMPPPPPPPAS